LKSYLKLVYFFVSCAHKKAIAKGFLFAIKIMCKHPKIALFTFIREILPLQWNRRLTLFPQLGHAQQILDVIIEQLLKEFLSIVVVGLGPLPCGHSIHIAIVLGICT
jgi:hypothetical protein